MLPSCHRQLYRNHVRLLEVLQFYEEKIRASKSLEKFHVSSGKYFLVTLHRAENVDIPERLAQFIHGFERLLEEYQLPIICSLHPRTKSQLQKQQKNLEHKGLIVTEPLGLFDFVHLEKHAMCVLSDSGTVQEECCLFKVPNVTIRDVTERPETVECGSNILSGSSPDSIAVAVKLALLGKRNWQAPIEYLSQSVSSTVLNILFGFR